MSDSMNLQWARALLREVTGIYVAHLLPGTRSDAELAAAVEAFVNGGNNGLHMWLNGPVDASELEPFWPAMPDLAGVDLFAEHEIAGME